MRFYARAHHPQLRTAGRMAAGDSQHLMLSDLAPAIAAGFTRSIALLRQAGAHD